MEFTEQKISGVFEITCAPHEDTRGYFMRTYDEAIFEKLSLNRKWVQENHSLSKVQGTVRGIHFQYSPDCETKLLRVITGAIFFAVIDLRRGSKTLGQWTSVVVSAEKKNLLYIPRGCAPGMCTLTGDCNLAYKVDNFYNPNNEDVIRWDDPDLGIRWPISEPAVISDRDANGKSLRSILDNTDNGLVP
jgi:dTDP-4-dehydrorhamnose 3,5-epimerase